jgi:hypothetical protein
MLKRVLGASALVLMLAASPVAAAAPVHFGPLTQTSVTQDSGAICGFPIRWDVELTVQGTRHFDNDGNLIRVQAHVQEMNTVTNLDTGEVIVEGPDSFMQVSYIENGRTVLQVANGIAVHLQSDPKVLDVGRVAWIPLGGGRTQIVFLAGPHDVREAAEEGTIVQGLAAFCDAFD